MTSDFEVVSFGISDQGLVRTNNEDVWGSVPTHHFFVLADGMGGHKAGEVAAQEAVSNISMSVRRIFSSILKENFETDHIIQHLHYAMQDANCWVNQLGENNEAYSGMGTTLSCFLLHRSHLIYAHVGDSRIYQYNTKLRQLSEDHSLKNHLLKKGKLTIENMNRYPYKNRITKAIGTQDIVSPDIDFIRVEEGDVFFLCSDGLTDLLSDDEITKILEITPCVEECSKNLVVKAKEKGGRDNITVVMIKIVRKKTKI
ncbi:MAG: Stp1/IreP family PP2C-type Ser/Thr phosphatase [Chlamydiae bacterium]|nr:Stp1/IreP family PP2C-type Ser/Thr phosphatase [Chlamydiota bacterium]